MKIVNAKYIKSLKPCKGSYEKGIKSYPNWSGTLKQFLNLKKISHDDKVWVFIRSIDKELVPLVLADFAEQVLHIYEEKYPNDLRPRQSIKATRDKDRYASAADAYAAYTAYTTAYNAAAYTAAAAYAAEIDMDKIQIQIMKRYLK